MGVEFKNEKLIFTPYRQNKNIEFDLKNLKGSGLQIISYLSKTVPEAFKSRPILDLEAFALLTALFDFSRYISNTKTTVLTDSRVLYYLFSPRICNSVVKIKRWALKLISDYPNVNLCFIRTTENLADFLTREYSMLPGDKERFVGANVKISDFSHQ